MNDVNCWITFPEKEYNYLKKVCKAAGTTIPVFIRCLIQKFAADPDRFIAAFDDYE